MTSTTGTRSAELLLLLACLQGQLANAPTPDWSVHLRAGVDFNKLLAMCQHHEVTPLVYRTMQALSLEEQVLEPFRQEVQRQTLLSFRLTQHLLAILRTFAEAKIPIIPHKGVMLSHMLFADIARRPTKDLDVVVRKEHYPHAKTLLQTLGYVGPTTDSGEPLDDAWESFYLKRMHHVTFFREDDGASVELHWRFSPDFRGSQLEAEAWASLQPHTFFGVQTAALPKPLLYALLCEHGAAHHYFRLKWLFDAAVLMDREGFHLPNIPSLRNQLVATAHLCHRLFTLKPETNTRTTPTQRWLAMRILQQFGTFPITHISGADRYRVQLALLNSSDPRLVWPVFRHYLYEDDSFRQHTAGPSSYLASAARLLRYPFRRR